MHLHLSLSGFMLSPHRQIDVPQFRRHYITQVFGWDGTGPISLRVGFGLCYIKICYQWNLILVFILFLFFPFLSTLLFPRTSSCSRSIRTTSTHTSQVLDIWQGLVVFLGPRAQIRWVKICFSLRSFTPLSMASTNPNNLNLHIASPNVQGLNSQIKRQYHSFKMYVLLLQETHFPSSYNPSFIHQHYSHFYLANAENKTRGIAIFFSKRLHFPPTKVIRDPSDRYLLVKGSIDGVTYSFISYYAPNMGQAFFLIP